MSAPPEAEGRRRLFMVLSPRALPYAQLALRSLFANAAEPFQLTLITDTAADRQEIDQFVRSLSTHERAQKNELPLLHGAEETTLRHAQAEPCAPSEKHSTFILPEDELADAEADRFRGLPNLRAFRRGHPCWRKITDPLLLSRDEEEMVLLDPDLYFPNPFTFERTPAAGLLLMWQRPNCLWPPEVVHRAMRAHIPLARHVDIGVAHWRGDVDLQWLDWLIAQLGGSTLPRAMHVEAIVWAALAMRLGGGYLDPRRWVCWHRTQSKRVRVKFGHTGATILASEPWAEMKCFHAGGEAKWWLPAALAGRAETARPHTASSPLLPFVPLTAARYACERGAKKLVGQLGYHRLFGSRAS